ncbi:MAG: type II secretion system F family protein [Thermoproteales archaeon]|nr:type II secretion system F family protein [Thermoproteales archaeon]
MRREDIFRKLILGKPKRLGLFARLKYRDHVSRLEKEAPFAILASSMVVESVLPPLKIIDVLSKIDSLEAVSFEAKRILRDTQLNLKHLAEQLEEEVKNNTGVWGKLLASIVNVEASGLDPRLVFNDLLQVALRDLRTMYEKTSRRFQTLISSASVIFGAFPMMISILFAIMASSSIIPLVLSYMFAVFFMAVTWLFTVDLQVPRLADYKPFYKRILFKWLPLGAALGVSSYIGLIYTPLTLVYRKALSLLLGTLAFSIPSYIEWRKQKMIQEELFETLPIFLRSIAEQTSKGFSVGQAIENILESGGLGKYTSRLISLIVKEARIFGSLRDAYGRLKELLPFPWRVSLELLALTDELGSGSGALHRLADTMSEYMISIREFRRSSTGYSWLSLMMAGLTLVLMMVVSNTVMVKLALIGSVLEENKGMVSLPFNPPSPSELPVLKDWIYFMITSNILTLAVVTGKTLGWCIGDSLKELLKTSLLTLTFMIVGWGML